MMRESRTLLILNAGLFSLILAGIQNFISAGADFFENRG